MFDFERYEFGIIEDYEKEKKYLMDIGTYYNPKKYHCVKLLEDFWWSFYKDTRHMETLNVDEDLKRNKGFDVFGGSVVPVSSLEELKKAVLTQMSNKEKVLEENPSIKDASTRFDKEFSEVLKVIEKAIKENKNVIFYGN